jgi:hypothetical protein
MISYEWAAPVERLIFVLGQFFSELALSLLVLAGITATVGAFRTQSISSVETFCRTK